jgi:hypothetical protein
MLKRQRPEIKRAFLLIMAFGVVVFCLGFFRGMAQ